MDRTLTITTDGKTFQVRSELTHLEVYSICQTLITHINAGQDPFPNPVLLTEDEAQRRAAVALDERLKKAAE